MLRLAVVEVTAEAEPRMNEEASTEENFISGSVDEPHSGFLTSINIALDLVKVYAKFNLMTKIGRVIRVRSCLATRP